MDSDYVETFSALSDENVEFLVVGAHALAAHGLPRATVGLDLWVRPTPENARRTWDALARFGAPVSTLTPAELERPALVLQLGVAPCRIDVLTSIDGVNFDDAWPKRKHGRIGDRDVPVLGASDLLANKRATGGDKDRLDATWLEKRLRRLE